MVCPAPDFMRRRYHPPSPWRLPLYYPYRWLKLYRDLSSMLIALIQERVKRTRPRDLAEKFD